MLTRLKRLFSSPAAAQPSDSVSTPDDGFRARPAEDLLNENEERLFAIRRTWQSVETPPGQCSEEAYQEFIHSSFVWVAEYCQELPASRAGHHDEPGGLLTHLLETAGHANREIAGLVFDSHLDGIDRKRRVVHWHAMTTLLALAHDLGKCISEFTVSIHKDDRDLAPFLRPDQQIWPSHDTKLLDWLASIERSRYVYTFKDFHHGKHEQFVNEFIRWMIDDTGLSIPLDIYEQVMHKTPPHGETIHNIVKKSDRDSAGNYNFDPSRQSQSHRSVLTSAISRLIRSRRWLIDRYTSPVHAQDGVVHIDADKGCVDILEEVQADGNADLLNVELKVQIKEKLIALGLVCEHLLEFKLHDAQSTKFWLVATPVFGSYLIGLADRASPEKTDPAIFPKTAKAAADLERSARSSQPSPTPPAPSSNPPVSSPIAETNMLSTRTKARPATKQPNAPSPPQPSSSGPPPADFYTADGVSGNVASDPSSSPTNRDSVDEHRPSTDSEIPFCLEDIGAFIDRIDHAFERPKAGQSPNTEGDVFPHRHTDGLAVRKRFILDFLKERFPNADPSYPDFFRFLHTLPGFLSDKQTRNRSLLIVARRPYGEAIYESRWQELFRSASIQPSSPSSSDDVPDPLDVSHPTMPVRHPRLNGAPTRNSYQRVSELTFHRLKEAGITFTRLSPFLAFIVHAQTQASGPEDSSLVDSDGKGSIRAWAVNTFLDSEHNSGSNRFAYPQLRAALSDSGFLDLRDSYTPSKGTDLLLDSDRYRLLAECVSFALSSEASPQ